MSKAKPGGNVVAAGLHNTFIPRAYQLEMLDESMRRNIIVTVALPWSPFPSVANLS